MKGESNSPAGINGNTANQQIRCQLVEVCTSKTSEYLRLQDRADRVFSQTHLEESGEFNLALKVNETTLVLQL